MTLRPSSTSTATRRAIVAPGRRSLVLWVAAGLLGFLAMTWAFPRAYPLFPQHWELSRSEASAIALERFRDLGDPVASPYVVSRLVGDTALEVWLQKAALAGDATAVANSLLARDLFEWEVTVYPPGAFKNDWAYQARIGLDGEVRTLGRRVPPTEKRDGISDVAAIEQARKFLAAQGFDLTAYEEPTVRGHDQVARRDLDVRFRSREHLLGAEFPYGVEVNFAGPEPVGFGTWYEDPRVDEAKRLLQPAILINQSKILILFVLLIFVAVFFVRRYHEGEVGVARGAQIFLFVLAVSIVGLILVATPAVQESNFGVFTRVQQTWVWAAQILMLFFVPMGLVAALSWSVGEAFCRERWGRKLAAFDALLHGKLDNATVSASALRGTMAGLAVAGVMLLALYGLRQLGVWAPVTQAFGPWWDSSGLPGVALVLMTFSFGLYGELFGRLFLVPLLVRRFGVGVGATVATVVCALLFWPQAMSVPLLPSWLLWAALCGFYIFLFLRYDLLTTILASIVSQVAVQAWVLLIAADYSLQVQGALALTVVLVPLFATLRHLRSDRQFEYRYEDIPPHVRRIADRERQRVELETARNIQSSILPDLPPQLHGVEIAHAYLPASEVGGDFYDVLALEDGRLAVAVGDVAGHGVSSGLVMSMAKSALAVQVTFDPEVQAVFTTLNRMVFQSARKRLLATLCYVLLDPKRRELCFATAGHLVPYRISKDGQLDSFDASSYPLGVRDSIEVDIRAAKVASGDTLVLYSDGVVEARREDSDDQWGFRRLEDAIRLHAGRGPAGLRDGILRDLEAFTGIVPREDDLTLLILRVP
jgi:hypothetical protein